MRKTKCSIKKIMLLYYLLFFISIVKSQDPPDPYEQAGVQLPTPQAAALAKYADFPVSLYSGTPQISFPLCQLNCGEISVPISISYHASGIKVEDVPGTVGLGWVLNAGGLITRTIRGASDNHPADGYLIGLSGVVEINPDDEAQDIWDRFISSYAPGCNTEPDIYYYNFNGYTGSFYFGADGKFVLKKHDNLDIISYRIGNVPCFKIIDASGITYYFEESVRSKMLPEANYLNWYLTKIENHSKTDFVTFTYRADDYSYYKVPNFTRTYIVDWTSNLDDNELMDYTDEICRINHGTEKNISTITNRQGQQVIFNYRSYAGVHVLGEDLIVLNDIEVLNENGSTIKTIEFDNERIETSVPYSDILNGTYCQNLDDYTWMNYRLYLESFSEVSLTGERVTHSFEYYGRTASNKDGLPNRLSCGQDWFGYYNGADDNEDLIPGFDGPLPYLLIGSTGCYDIPPNFYDDKTAAGSNRDPNFDDRIKGTIKKITYPTGGSAEFTFSSHPHPPTHPGPNDYYGIRVDEIIYKDSDGSIENQKSYSYNVPLAGYWPEFYQYIFYDEDIDALDPYPIKCGGIGDPPYQICLQFKTHPGVDLGLYEGPMIGYTNVTETSFGGTTTYTFSNDYAEDDLHVDINIISYSPLFTCNSLAGSCPPPPCSSTKDWTKSCSPHFFWQCIDGNLSMFMLGLMNNCDGYVNYSWPGKTWPLGPYPDISWKRGTLLRKAMNGLAIDYVYNWIEIDKVPAMKIKTITEGAIYLYYHYFYTAIWPRLDQEIVTRDNVTTTTNYYYDGNNHRFPTRITTTQSDGSEIIKEYQYPLDIQQEFTEYPDYVEVMVDNHMIANPLFTKTIDKKPDGTQKVTDATYTEYYINPVVKPKSIYKYFGDQNLSDISLVYYPQRDYVNFTSSVIMESLDFTSVQEGCKSTETFVFTEDVGTFSITGGYLAFDDLSTYYEDIQDYFDEHEINDDATCYVPIQATIYRSKGDNIIYRIRGADGVTPPSPISFSTTIYDPIKNEIFRIEILKKGFCLNNATQQFTYNGSEGHATISYSGYSVIGYNLPDYFSKEYTYIYNYCGNIIEVQKTNDMKTSYYWAYNNSYPILKGENIAQSTLKIRFYDALDNFESGYSENGFLTALGNLTLQSQKDMLENFIAFFKTYFTTEKFTFYTYKPLVGMTSQTGPDGITIYYEYDSFGRLARIKNNDGDILEEYKYHYIETTP